MRPIQRSSHVQVELLLIGAAAAATAPVLFLIGLRAVAVPEGAARTLRGRFLVAVAFFLAVFGRMVDRVRGADAPPATTRQQQLSLAEMNAAGVLDERTLAKLDRAPADSS